jgi:hypothetical protein
MVGRLGWLLLLLLCLGGPARAQQPGCSTSNPPCTQISIFTPTGAAQFNVTSVSSNTPFPSNGANLLLLVTNNGGIQVNVALGNNTITVTPSSGTPVQAGQTVCLPQGLWTNVAGITSAGSASLLLQSGAGSCPISIPFGKSGGSGGFPSLFAPAVVANAELGVVPPNAFLGPMLLLEETAGEPATISVGTTLGASDVVSVQPPVAANGTLIVPIGSFSKGWFSASLSQPLYLTTSAGGSSIKATLFYVVGQ